MCKQPPLEFIFRTCALRSISALVLCVLCRLVCVSVGNCGTVQMSVHFFFQRPALLNTVTFPKARKANEQQHLHFNEAVLPTHIYQDGGLRSLGWGWGGHLCVFMPQQVCIKLDEMHKNICFLCCFISYFYFF